MFARGSLVQLQETPPTTLDDAITLLQLANINLPFVRKPPIRQI